MNPLISSLLTPVFFDTSCSMRLILKEAQEVGAWAQAEKLSQINRPIYFCSELARLETPAALRAKRRGKLISNNQHQRASSLWDLLSSNEITFTPIDKTIMNSALSLVLHSNIQCRLRSLDCIQFASFMELHRRLSRSILFTADHSLCSLAIEHSVPFFNPLTKN